MNQLGLKPLFTVHKENIDWYCLLGNKPVLTQAHSYDILVINTHPLLCLSLCVITRISYSSWVIIITYNCLIDGYPPFGVLYVQIFNFAAYKESHYMKRCDNALLQMLAHDLQPLAIVEYPGFMNYINSMGAHAKLPTKHTLLNTLLPAKCRRQFL